jgi:hypothetical protein
MRQRLTIGLACLLLCSCGDEEPGAGGASDATIGTGARDAGSRDREHEVPFEETTEDPVDELDVDQLDAAAVEEVPSVETDCHNGIDDDRDGRADCRDDDCIDQCEVCSDLLDNDGDGLIDCSDPDCTDAEGCPEFCANNVDDDANGLIDCADPECVETHRCANEPMPIDTYEFRQDMSYMYFIQFPPSGVDCCFDYDEDDALDNNLLLILSLIPGYDAQESMSIVVNTGDVALLVEWREIPDDLEGGGAADFFLFRGIPISPPPPSFLDRPIGPSTNVWRDGDGLFQVTRDSFDDLGPRYRFDENTISESHLVGEPRFMSLTIPIAELGLTLSFTLHQARVEMDLTRFTPGVGPEQIRTVGHLETGTGGSVMVGGGRLGGYIRADDLFAFFNAGADACGCAKPFGATGPMIDYGERPIPDNAYVASCNWMPLDGSSCGFDAGAMCTNLRDICSMVPGLPFLLDVDSNKNGIAESMSTGLYFDLTGATLAETPVEP